MVGDYQHKDFQARSAAALKFGAPAVVLALAKLSFEYYTRVPREPPAVLAPVEETAVACLMALRELVYTEHNLANTVLADEVPFLLSCLGEPKLFEAAISVGEEVLSSRSEMFPVCFVRTCGAARKPCLLSPRTLHCWLTARLCGVCCMHSRLQANPCQA